MKASKQNRIQTTLENYFQVTTKETQDYSKTTKQDYICKEELNLSWQKEDELFHGRLFNSVVMIEKLPEQYINKSSINKGISVKNISSTVNDSNVVKIEKSPEQSPDNSFLNTENTTPKAKVAVNDRNRMANLITRFCENCKKIVISNLIRSSSCPKCKCVLAYECKKCRKHATTYIGIFYHLKSTCQSEGYYYQCAGCPYQSRFKFRVKEHMQKIHKSLPFTDIKIIATEDLQNVPKTSELYLHKCSKCGKQFKYLHHMKKHSRTCVYFKYQVVGNGTSSNPNLENQSQQHGSTPNFDVIKWAKLYCKKCDKRSDFKDTVHIAKKCNDCKTALSFECSKCAKQYGSSNGIVYHMQMKCAAREMYYCSKCDYKSPGIKSLTIHYKNVHEPNSVECPNCKSALKNKAVLVKHLQYCGKEPYLHCDKCSYKTNNPSTYRIHMRRHNYNEKRTEATCSKCGKILKNEFSLKSHLNYCGQEPRLNCTMCTYKSHYKQTLKKHMMRTHFKRMNKYPDCPNCGVQFENKYCANAHLRFCGTSKSHFQCDYCPYKCERKVELTGHLTRMHLQNETSDESDVDIC